MAMEEPTMISDRNPMVESFTWGECSDISNNQFRLAIEDSAVELIQSAISRKSFNAPKIDIKVLSLEPENCIPWKITSRSNGITISIPVLNGNGSPATVKLLLRFSKGVIQLAKEFIIFFTDSVAELAKEREGQSSHASCRS
jgi:hypothetical protein